MANPMNSASFRSIVEPILNEEFNGLYEQRDDEWEQVFRLKKGIERNYHEEPVLYGFGAAPELPEGMPVTYDQGGVLFIARFYYKVYGLAFALTKVLVEDGDHIRIGQTYARHLAQSMIETKETLCANILNRAFNASYPGGDGKELCATDHPIVGGTFSNKLATPANLSQTSLEQILVQISQAVDNNGKKIRLKAKKLVVPPALQFQAEVLTKSVLRTGQANNDINPVVSSTSLPDGYAKMSRLTSQTAWWVKTEAPVGLMLLMRRALEKSMEGDFDTDSMRYKSTERYIPGWVDPRDVYGTPGI